MPIYKRASQVQRALSLRIVTMSRAEFDQFCAELRLPFPVEGYKKDNVTTEST